MSIPDFQTIMLPLMLRFQDGREHDVGETVEALADQFNLSQEERAALLPSGRTEKFRNRIAWAKSHLKVAGLLSNPRRGVYQITERGKQVLAGRPNKINLKFLDQFPEHVAFHSKRENQVEDTETSANQTTTPDETLDAAYARIREDLAAEILQRLKNCSPNFFERLVVEVIVKMGYGGSLKDAGMAIGKTGDDGIDGIIKEDKLGLDTIFIQAKRWENTVGRPEIQKFVGALTGQRARKGLFITTADFSQDAIEYVRKIDMKVVLIDGTTLAQLMIDHNVGVSTVATYEIKKIDSDYFVEE